MAKHERAGGGKDTPKTAGKPERLNRLQMLSNSLAYQNFVNVSHAKLQIIAGNSSAKLMALHKFQLLLVFVFTCVPLFLFVFTHGFKKYGQCVSEAYVGVFSHVRKWIASVEVIGLGHDASKVISADENPFGTGLILQKEIHFFRQGRGNLDVVRGEVLPAYIQNVREDGKIDLGLRVFGGKAKSQETGAMIMERLKSEPDGVLPIGDKSSPADINSEFPGVSKSQFKKAVGALYKQGLIVPSPDSIRLS